MFARLYSDDWLAVPGWSKGQSRPNRKTASPVVRLGWKGGGFSVYDRVAATKHLASTSMQVRGDQDASPPTVEIKEPRSSESRSQQHTEEKI